MKIYHNEFFDDQSIKYGFTDRTGGYSVEPFSSLNLAFHVEDNPENVTLNRKILSEEMKFDEEKLTWSSQVHGDNIFILKDKNKVGFIGEYDGIITNLKDIPIMTLYADCIPILLHDPVKNIIGTIHAGWKGTFLEIAKKAVSLMIEEFSSNPNDIKALIGPGICKEDYLVSEELIKEFNYKFPEIVSRDNYNLDLKLINKQILEKKGIIKIFDMEICTSCDNENFFSFRKEKGMTGRFAALIMLK